MLENIDYNLWNKMPRELIINDKRCTIEDINKLKELEKKQLEAEKIKMPLQRYYSDFYKMVADNPPFNSVTINQDGSISFVIASNRTQSTGSNDDPQISIKKKEENAMKNIQVKSIKYDRNYTTVTWTDGTKTTVRCSYNDVYSPYNGFCSALAKKIFGTSSQVRKLVDTKDEAVEIAKKKTEQKEKERLAKIARNRKERYQVKYLAKQMVIEERARKLAEQMLESK